MCQKNQEPSLAGPGASLGGIGGAEPEPSWTRSETSEPPRKINKIHVARQEFSGNTGGTPYAGAPGRGHAAKTRGRTHKQLNQTSQKVVFQKIYHFLNYNLCLN